MAGPVGDDTLEVYEQDTSNRPPFFLTFAEVKLLSITGVGTVPPISNAPDEYHLLP